MSSQPKVHLGPTATLKVDLCDILPCNWGNQVYYSFLNLYMGVTKHCGSWGDVGWNTGPHNWGYRPVPVLKRVSKGRNQLERLSVIRGKAVKDCKPKSCNPLLASLNDLYEGDAGDCPGIEERSTDTITTFGILISKENTFADRKSVV